MYMRIHMGVHIKLPKAMYNPTMSGCKIVEDYV